jgi:thioredoxin reductase
MDKTYDVVVIGGGAAGLSGALALGRARRSVLVIDAGDPRNAPAGHVHNYLGREGTPPGELLALGRREVEQYGVQVLSGRAVSATGQSDGTFVVTLEGAAVTARRLLVTTGLVDELPDLPGVAEGWGRSVLHCPYCHGWEVRDQALGILGLSPLSIHQAQLFRQWSDDVVLFLHTASPPGDDEAEQLAARGIRVVGGEVVAWEAGGVRMASGELVPRQVLVVGAAVRARAEVLLSLGLETADFEMGGHVLGTYVACDPTGLTAVPGVWVAGNVADPRAQVITSAAAGLWAGAAINSDLIAEETHLAVERYRAAGG